MSHRDPPPEHFQITTGLPPVIVVFVLMFYKWRFFMSTVFRITTGHPPGACFGTHRVQKIQEKHNTLIII